MDLLEIKMPAEDADEKKTPAHMEVPRN